MYLYFIHIFNLSIISIISSHHQSTTVLHKEMHMNQKKFMCLTLQFFKLDYKITLIFFVILNMFFRLASRVRSYLVYTVCNIMFD